MAHFTARVITDTISWSLCQHNTQKLNHGGCLGRSVVGVCIDCIPATPSIATQSSSTQTVSLERQGFLPLRGGKQPQSTLLTRDKIADLCLIQSAIVPTRVTPRVKVTLPRYRFSHFTQQHQRRNSSVTRPETAQSPASDLLTRLDTRVWRDFTSPPQSSQLPGSEYIMKKEASKQKILTKRYH
jgi:hypothetical protein